MKLIYNPEQNLIAELVPLYAKAFDESNESVFPDYTITFLHSNPVAYVMFLSEKEDGTLVNAEIIEKKLADGTVVEIS